MLFDIFHFITPHFIHTTQRERERERDMKDAIDTLLLAADKKSEVQPTATGQPLSTTADLDAPQSQQACTRSEQPEHPAPKAKHMPLPLPNKSTGAKKDAPALSAPMLPIPTERHLPSYKKPNAALTFPEKLMHMMTYAEAQCATNPNFCVAWDHGGAAFVVHDADAFTKDVIPRFFKATKFASFTRKLYRWGFRQTNRGSVNPVDPMIFSNDNFHRDHKYLMANMRSTTNKKQKLNDDIAVPTTNINNLSNTTTSNALAFPNGFGMGLNNFSALPQGMPGMAAMAGMGMTFPPGMTTMGLMQNNAAMMMPATITAGTNTPDGSAGMATGTGTITPSSGVAGVSAGMKRKAQEDILDSLDPTKAPGWNQLSSEERIRILQQALDTTATQFAAVNAEQQAGRDDSFSSAAASTASMPSTTPPTASGSSLPHLDQLQNFQQQLMFSQGQQTVAPSSSQQQQSFSRTTLAERLRTAHQKYAMPLPQDITSQQQVTNATGTDQGLASQPNMDVTKATVMGSLPNTGLNSMLAPPNGIVPATDLQHQHQQLAGQQQADGFSNVQ